MVFKLPKIALPQRRWLLWLMLVGLVLALLVMLIWLAARYESSQVQDNLERDASQAVDEVRSALTRNVQSLQAIQFNEPNAQVWANSAEDLLRQRREMVRIEWRDPQLQTKWQVDSPYRAPVFERMGRESSKTDVSQACSSAAKLYGPAYSNSYFVSLADGLGIEVMEVCLAQVVAGRLTGFLVATYSLPDLLVDLLGRQAPRIQEVSFIEPDGTRLALRSVGPRGSRLFMAQQLVDLPGNTLVLRLTSSRGAPELFPNVLTALVTLMSIALLSVLGLLVKDNRRRLRAEHNLGDALAFRKAMEDSLLTGLRARDLRGRTTYVNPAFCKMVGFNAQELEQSEPAPYWPRALLEEYASRQAIRLSGNVPPREGFESVFVRKDGSHFPVLIIEAPLINAQGLQTGWMSACIDISEQRRVQELSRTSQERLQATARLATVGEMASLLSHELNQPLAAISSYAAGSVNVLSDLRVGAEQKGLAPVWSPDQGADFEMVMRRIAEQAERAGKIIKSVHDFVRRRDQSRAPVAPQALFDAVLPLVSLQAVKLSIQVQPDVQNDLPWVMCDRTMIEQVLLNLARNAMQAMDQPGVATRVLRLTVRRAGRSTAPDLPDLAASDISAGTPLGTTTANELLAVVFSVADFGFGISEEVKAQLFTPFFTTKAEGMGLGLSLCRTVVEQHGSALVFEPNLPCGTVFSFTLPSVGESPQV